MGKAPKPEQRILSGILTEEDVIRAHYKRIGSMGGRKKTEKQQAARRATIQVARAARKRKAEGKG